MEPMLVLPFNECDLEMRTVWQGLRAGYPSKAAARDEDGKSWETGIRFVFRLR